MTEQEVQTIERSIEKLTETIRELVTEKTEIEQRISELETIQSNLLRLLPQNKRIEHLFD